MKYRSITTPEVMHQPAQFLAEIVTLRIMKNAGVEPFEYFWREKRWEKPFRQQIVAAHALLKQFDFLAVFRALLSATGKNCYSLRAPFFRGVCEQEQYKLSMRDTSTIELEEIKNIYPQKQFSPSQSEVAKLRNE